MPVPFGRADRWSLGRSSVAVRGNFRAVACVPRYASLVTVRMPVSSSSRIQNFVRLLLIGQVCFQWSLDAGSVFTGAIVSRQYREYITLFFSIFRAQTAPTARSAFGDTYLGVMDRRDRSRPAA